MWRTPELNNNLIITHSVATRRVSVCVEGTTLSKCRVRRRATKRCHFFGRHEGLFCTTVFCNHDVCRSVSADMSSAFALAVESERPASFSQTLGSHASSTSGSTQQPRHNRWEALHIKTRFSSPLIKSLGLPVLCTGGIDVLAPVP